jgi:ribosome maturation factor RimP
LGESARVGSLKDGGNREMGLWPIFLFRKKRAMNKEGLISLLEPTVKALGYDLVDLDFRAGRGGLLRLFIDKAPGISLSDGEYVSRQVSDLLDVEDPISSTFSLEVSSPGLDRRLRTLAHFSAAIGSEVRVELKRAIDGRKRYRGLLTAVDDNELEIRGDGMEWHFPLSEVESARLVPTG